MQVNLPFLVHRSLDAHNNNYQAVKLPSESEIHEVACAALQDLLALVMLPDLIVDESITLSHAARSLLSRIVSGFTNEQRLLLCCTKWNFKSKWDFYNCAFVDTDAMRQHMKMAVRIHHKYTGEDMTIEDGLSCFTQLKVYKKIFSICECAKCV